MKFTPTARSLGIFSAAATVILVVAYAVTLAVGLLSLIVSIGLSIGFCGDSLEVLIIVMIPAMIALMVAVHAWAPMNAKALSLTSVVFMGLLAGVTCIVHFCVLTLSRQPEFTEQSWLPLVLSFEWPSVVYALDILGWDVFFPLSMLFAALVFQGSRLAAWIRVLMIASGVLALAGSRGRRDNAPRSRGGGRGPLRGIPLHYGEPRLRGESALRPARCLGRRTERYTRVPRRPDSRRVRCWHRFRKAVLADPTGRPPPSTG